MNRETFYSPGKLLVTAEYLVLDGARALAVPTKLGQSLSIQKSKVDGLRWSSFDHTKNCWFEADFDHSLNIRGSNDMPVAERLMVLLKHAKRLNANFSCSGLSARTQMEFPNNWGLGSSSTLINNIAQWAQVDAYALMDAGFGGSGYDVACAQTNHPILYQLKDNHREVTTVEFYPPFADQLFFVHLNQKQDSREGIAHYRSLKLVPREAVERISQITQELLDCTEHSEFERLMVEHELILSGLLSLKTVRERLFPAFKGTVKSLGAWGGDFVLAVGGPSEMDYFKTLGYRTIIPFKNMVKAKPSATGGL